ncbi:uncharacterized protein LOC144230425 [Crocuta crocuta]
MEASSVTAVGAGLGPACLTAPGASAASADPESRTLLDRVPPNRPAGLFNCSPGLAPVRRGESAVALPRRISQSSAADRGQRCERPSERVLVPVASMFKAERVCRVDTPLFRSLFGAIRPGAV